MRHTSTRIVTLAILAASQLSPFAVVDSFAAHPAYQSCDAAAAQASRQTGTPVEVLRAIGRVESGRTTDAGFHPWPWTVNVEGRGRWFESRQAALSYLQQRQANGSRSFDVGCFQINHRWHGEAFANLDAMFEPSENALYAATFLHNLYQEFGDWTRAIGAYHSRTEVHATRYAALVVARLDMAQLQAAPQILVAPARSRSPDRLSPTSRPAQAILTSSSASPASSGSLFPEGDEPRRSFIAFAPAAN
jgi:hypothetical protein